MPLPLLLIGAAGLFGASKLAGAYVYNDDARKLNVEAHDLVQNREWVMEETQEATTKALNALGRKKAHVLNGSIKNFVSLFSQIHNIDFRAPSEYDESGKFRLDQSSFDGLRELSGISMAITDASAGALTAFGAYGLATMAGIPSAGAAITALTGLATNSTLSFLGGGSLAAGVTSVLGGMLTAPALAVLGIFVESSAARNLEDAKSNKAQALKFAKQIDAAATACNGIRRAAYMFERLLMRLDPLMNIANERIRQIISSSGTDYNSYSIDEKKSLGSAASLAHMIKTVIITQLLSQDGELIPEAIDKANEIRASLPA